MMRTNDFLYREAECCGNCEHGKEPYCEMEMDAVCQIHHGEMNSKKWVIKTDVCKDFKFRRHRYERKSNSAEL